MELRAGFRFVPSDEELVTYLTEKVYGGGGEARSDRVVLGECDMYGDREPWNIWNDHGGRKLKIKAGEDLYMFTKLKKVSVNGSRNHKRRIGSGTWSGAYCREVAGGVAKKRHFSYENEGCSEHHLAWIMHEYSLVDGSADYVLCRLRRGIKKNINKKYSKSVTIQTKNLDDDQEIIKKQRLGVESESHEDSSITIFQNLNHMEQQHYLPTKNNLITHYQKLSDDDQQVINYIQNNNMQVQVDGALNNNNITCIPIFDDMFGFGELFDSDSHQELKEISLDDFINVARSSTTTLGALSDVQVLKKISCQDFNVAVAKSSSMSSTYGADHHVNVVQEHSFGTCCMDENLLDDQKLLENFMEELPNILENIDHGIGAKSSWTTTLGALPDEEVLKEISCQDFNDAVEESSSISSTYGDDHHVKVVSCESTIAVQEHSYGTCCMDEELLDDQKLLENFMEELPNILENIAESVSSSSTKTTTTTTIGTDLSQVVDVD